MVTPEGSEPGSVEQRLEAAGIKLTASQVMFWRGVTAGKNLVGGRDGH
jgi:hypothetical protein